MTQSKRSKRPTPAARRPALILLQLGSNLLRAARLYDDGACRHIGKVHEVAFSGVRDGTLVDLAGARSTLARLFGRLQASEVSASHQVIAAIGGSHVRCTRSQGAVRFRMPVTLREAHMDEVLERASDVGLPTDQEVLHVLANRFSVDGAGVPRPPLGMRARSLVADVSLVTVSRLALDNLERVLRQLGFDLVDAASETLVAARAALGQRDRLRGTILVDFGAENLGACAYRNNVLAGLVSLPMGAALVTRDIAYALQIERGDAEALKCGMHGGMPAVARGFSARALAQVTEPRIRELLTLVRDALQTQHACSPHDRVVLTGGGSRLEGVLQIAERVFAVPVRRSSSSWDSLVDRGELVTDDADVTPVFYGLASYASRCGWEKKSRRGSSWQHAIEKVRRFFGAGDQRAGTGRVPGDTRRTSRVSAGPVLETPQSGEDLEVGDVRV